MKAMESFRRFAGTLTLSQQVGMGAAGVVVLLAGAAFFMWVTQPSYTVLYSDIDQSQLSQVIDSLDAAGVPYRLEGGGSRVMVPQNSVYRVRADLAADGVQGSVVPQGYELLDQQGLSVSDFRQRVDYQRALEGELARTLTVMRGIRSATVHLVIPEEALFIENQEPVTASVLIDPQGGQMAQSDIEAVVMLVASSVEGLEPAQVTVASTDGSMLHAAGEDTLTAMGSKQLRMTSEFETQLSTGINQMLTSVLGPGRASVVVRAQLDFDERSVESETYDPVSATPIRSQIREEAFTGEGAGAVGGVGVDGTPLPEGDGAYDYALNEETTEFGIDRVVVRTSEAPGAIERLSVAVVVDDGSLTGLAPPDIAALDALVAAAIGADPNRNDTVEVSAIPFPALPEIEAAEEEAPGGIMTMLPTIIGAIVLLVVTLALFLMTRSGKKKEKKAKKGEVVDSPEALGSGQVVDADALAQANAIHGLTDDVIQLVERQPEEIAVLLRSWLADRREPVS
jgi:flagellar M-ring protein FliF